MRVVADAVPDDPADEAELVELVDELPVPEDGLPVLEDSVVEVLVEVVEALDDPPVPLEELELPSSVTGTTVQ